MRTFQRLSARALLIVLASFAAATVTASAEGPLLTLSQAVGEALLRNDRMISQHDDIEQAGLGVRVQRNAFQPKIVPNILGSFGQTDVSNQTYRLDLSQRFTTGTEVRLATGASTAQIPSPTGIASQDIRFYNADTTLTLTQPLLRGAGPTVARRALTLAELRQADAARQRTLAEQQVTVEVASAYYRLVAQLVLVDVARKSLDRARKLRDASEAKLDAGLVSQLDVFRAQELTTQAELQLFDAEATVEDARDQLRFLMGRDSAAPFEVAAEIPKVVDPVTAEEAIATAFEKRQDLQSVIAAAADADRATAFARNQLLPQVDVNLGLTRRETANSLPSSFGLDRFQFATFFTISMPVDRTPQLVGYQNALIDRDRRRREIDTMRKRIADDVRRAIRQRDRVLRTIAASESSVEIGRREVEVAQLRYERGLSNNLDVVTAETNLLSVESRRISALAESAVARLGLRAITGILDPRTDVAEPADVIGPDGGRRCE